MIVIDHTEPNWAKKYRLSGRENGAASYSKDIVKFHVPVWKRYFPDATISTCAMMKNKVGTDVLIQYIHDNHKDDPIKDFHDVAHSAKRVIFVVAYRETKILAENAGYEAVFVPMGIDVKKVRKQRSTTKSKKNAMIFFGNLYPKKLNEYIRLRKECEARGIELHTISMNKYSKGKGKPQETLTQNQAWKIVSEYKYAAAIGRCYHESVALGCKTLIVGQEFRGVVLSKRDHIKFSEWNYNPTTVIGKAKSLSEGLDCLEDMKPFVYDISETAKILDKTLRGYDGRVWSSTKYMLSTDALYNAKRQVYADIVGLRLRKPRVDSFGNLSSNVSRKARGLTTRLSRIALPATAGRSRVKNKSSTPLWRQVINKSDDSRLKKVVHSGKNVVAIQVDDFTSLATSQKHLDIVVDTLNKAKIDYFLIPQSNPHRFRVGMLRKDKSNFYKQLVKTFKNTGLYIAPTSQDKMTRRRATPITDKGVNKDILLEEIVRVFSYPLSPHGLVFSGADHGCDIEFWSDYEDYKGSSLKGAQYARLGVPIEDRISEDSNDKFWVSPKRNRVSAILSEKSRRHAVISVGDKEYKSFIPYTEDLASDTSFPIDVVYSWVNGNDPKWRKRFEKYRNTKADSKHNTNSRYFDHEEMKYSLRSIHMFAPWVRNIYVVTDDQVPDWLDVSAPGIKVVDHKEVFSDPSVLPVFNSHAIAAQLHHIDGLSEHFIYFNDDVFIGRPLASTEFFETNGLSKQRLSKTNIGISFDDVEGSARSSAQKKVKEILKKELGKTITYGFPHVPAPFLRSVGYELEKAFPVQVMATSKSRFRSKDDISFGFLARHYALITGRAVETKSLLCPYIDIASNDLLLKLEDLLAMRPDTFCLNEAEEPEDINSANKLLHDFLEQYYPYPSPWEKR